MAEKDTIRVEGIAHNIGIACDKMNAEEWKRITFKIELAARKENFGQIENYVSKFKQEINQIKEKETV